MKPLISIFTLITGLGLSIAPALAGQDSTPGCETRARTLVRYGEMLGGGATGVAANNQANRQLSKEWSKALQPQFEALKKSGERYTAARNALKAEMPEAAQAIQNGDAQAIARLEAGASAETRQLIQEAKVAGLYYRNSLDGYNLAKKEFLAVAKSTGRNRATAEIIEGLERQKVVATVATIALIWEGVLEYFPNANEYLASKACTLLSRSPASTSTNEKRDTVAAQSTGAAAPASAQSAR